MKLGIGSIIMVHGWVMLKGLEAGQKYRVQSTPQHYGSDTYQFTKAKGKKVVARHYANSVDLWVNNPQNFNHIEVMAG
jgi:hypothetical protein